MGRGNPNPSPATRFKPGQAPKSDKPRGPTKTRVRKLADEKLDDMLGLAHKNVALALRKKNIGVSTWLIDRAAKERGTRIEAGLLEPLVGALETVEDVERISKSALLLAIKGDMSFEQLKAVQEALARHSVLAGVIELRLLREEVERMTRDVDSPATFTRDHMPSWGRLKPEDKGHEDAEIIDEPAQLPGENGMASGHLNGKANGSGHS